jgi:phage/plasmid-associated DNA primase
MKVEKKELKVLMKCLKIVLATEENSVFQTLTEDLLEITKSGNYKRDKQGIVYKQVKPYAYIRYKEPLDFLNEIFLDDKTFMSHVNNMDNMVKFMKQTNNSNFPFIEYDKDYLGFSNGVLNKVTCEFTEIANVTVKKYFDQEFNYTTDTPLMDSILDYQFNPETRDFIYACLGRLFGIRDTLGFMLYLLGEPGCGKSLIIDIMCECFDNIGAIGSTFEEKFGLSFLYNKDVVVCDDLPKNISKLFPQQTFQTIITCGKIPVSVKGGDGFTIDWNVPLLWAGNWFPDYIDKGQISRRMLVANFEKHVSRPDPTLKQRIVATELPAIIYKSLLAYKKLLDNIGKRDIWGICPEYFSDQQQDQKMETNPLFRFLLEKTFYKEGNRMLMSDIKEQFSAYIGKPIRKMDNGTFAQANTEYIVEKSMICKHCTKKAEKGCCESYCHNDRLCRVTVFNIELVNEY